jgi:IclR family pca regulon transcriptional regulator
VFIVARSEAARIVSTGVRLGTSLPAAATATGRVLLAAMGEDELDQALREYQPLRSTARSLITVSDIRDRVVRAREEGYSFTDEEIEIGVRALAVPVLDVNGTARAAMSVSAFAARISMDEMMERFLPVLKRQARRLGNML